MKKHENVLFRIFPFVILAADLGCLSYLHISTDSFSDCLHIIVALYGILILDVYGIALKFTTDEAKKEKRKKRLFYAFHIFLWSYVIFFNCYYCSHNSDPFGGHLVVWLFIVLPVSFLILLVDLIYLLVRYNKLRKLRRLQTEIAYSRHKAVSVKPLEDYRLSIVFNDGTKRIADIKPLIVDNKNFAFLENIVLFDRVYLKNGTVTWENRKGKELQIAPDRLYSNKV